MTRIAAYIVLILAAFLFAVSTSVWQVRVKTYGDFDDIVNLLETPDARYPSEPTELAAGEIFYDKACIGCHGEISDWRKEYNEPWRHSTRDVYSLIMWGHGIEYPDGFPYTGTSFEISRDHPTFAQGNTVWAVSTFVTVSASLDEIDETNMRAENLFGVYCTGCHGPMGFGNGPLAGDLGTPPRNLRDQGWLAGQSASGIYDAISGGMPENPNVSAMPSWIGVLDSNEILDLTQFIQSFSYHGERIPESHGELAPVYPDTNLWTWDEIKNAIPTAPDIPPGYLE